MLIVSKVLEKRPFHSYVIQGKFKVTLHAFWEKSFKVPIAFRRLAALVKVLKSSSSFGMNEFRYDVKSERSLEDG